MQQLDLLPEMLARITSVMEEHGEPLGKVESAGEMLTVEKSASDVELNDEGSAGVHEKLLFRVFQLRKNGRNLRAFMERV